MRPVARGTRVSLVLAGTLLVAGCGGTLGRGSGIGNPSSGGEDAVGLIERRASAEPSEPYWPFRLAEIRSGSGDGDGAEAALDDALRRDPLHAPSLALRSKRWFDTGRHNEAIALLEAARGENAAFPAALSAGLALHYDAVGRTEDAGAIVAALLKEDDAWDDNGAVLTYLRLRGPAFASSHDTARRALRADGSAVNHNNYGIALLYAGKPGEARKHLERAAELDPALPGPLYNLAIVDHFYRFDPASARNWYRRYRELSNDDPDQLEAVLSRELAATDGARTEDSR